MTCILLIYHRLGHVEIQCPGEVEGRTLWSELNRINGGPDNLRLISTAWLIDGQRRLEQLIFNIAASPRLSTVVSPSSGEEGDQPPILARQWDEAYTRRFRDLVEHRRFTPGGKLHKVKYKKIGGRRDREIAEYPWGDMGDGDYFVTKAISKRSREAVKVGIRQAAARYDMEIAIREWRPKQAPGLKLDDVEELGLRVTRVCGFVSLTKTAANFYRAERRQIPLQISDIEARRKRDWSNRKVSETYKAGRSRVLNEDEVVKPAPRLTNQELLEARRADAARELARDG